MRRGGPAPILLDEVVEVTWVNIDIVGALG